MTQQEQAWVTWAKDDDEAIEALTLLYSLRRISTSRKFLVFVSPRVSSQGRKALGQQFDGVLRLAKVNDPGILSTLGLPPPYKKCVILAPDLIFLENCEALFEHEGVGSSLDGDIVVLSPSLDEYEELEKTLESRKNHEQWIQRRKDFSPICDEFEVYMLENIIEVNGFKNIVRLNGKRPEEQRSQFYKDVCDYWEGLRNIAKSAFTEAEVSKNPTSEQNAKEPIAIVGLSFRFPGANNAKDFWNVLSSGEDQLRPIPESRWTARDGMEATSEERSILGGFLSCPVDIFDSKFFGLSPAELEYLDPQQRLLLEVAWEALEDAGINADNLKGTPTSIYSGLWKKDYYDLMTETGFRIGEFYRSYMGNSFGATGGRLSFLLGINGSNIVTESGCSSSFVALGMALKALKSNETDLALVAGANLLLRPFSFASMHPVICEDGRCKTFDSRANGYARAEGVAVLVLKRLSSALKDGDRIHALLKGYGEAQEGLSRSMGTPTADCEMRAMTLALKDAGLEPNAISYVEAHGTGTPVGDPLEMEAIRQVYGCAERNEPLLIGSVKTVIGHTESCSGLAGLIKTILALQRETIPPHLNLVNLNPRINLGAIPAEIPTELKQWIRSGTKRRMAGVSSYGITGTDTHLIVEEAPPEIEKPFKRKQLRPFELFTLSAKSAEALSALVDKYVEFLSQPENQDLSLSDICYTVNTGRAKFPHRLALVVESTSDLLRKLEKKHFGRSTLTEDSASVQSLCFLFTGQGSQYHKMGQTLYNTNTVFRDAWEECESIFRSRYGLEIRRFLWCDQPHPDLHRTINSQCAIFALEYSLLQLWASWGLCPNLVLGHSFGEVCAAFAAGTMGLEQTIRLVVERALLANSLPQGKMLAVKGSLVQVEALLNEMPVQDDDFWIDIATINSPEQTVVSGREGSILKFAAFCASRNVKNTLLEATQAFHSRDMEAMLGRLREVLELERYSPPTCRYISAVDGKELESKSRIIDLEYWLRHTRRPVRFVEAVAAAYKSGARLFLEIGSQPVLSALVTRNLDGVVSSFPSLRKKEEEWFTMLNSLGQLWLGGVPIQWDEFHKDYEGRKIRLPFYQFQRKRFWFTASPNLKQRRLGEGKKLHPLLGSGLDNASPAKIYENYLELSSLWYLRDHVVGQYVIFPAAGYLELALVAGRLALSTDQNLPLIVEGLKISSPLQLQEDEQNCTTKIQTLVDSSGQIQIFSQHSSEENWIGHSTASFKAIPTNEQSLSRDFLKLKSRICKASASKSCSGFYTQLRKFGLAFGPSFQSISKYWESENGELLAMINIPSDDKEYLCHPVAIDAMIQSFLLLEKQETLHLPVAIGKFVWFASTASSICYVHFSSSKNVASLWDSNGVMLGEMSRVELISTSLERITKSLNKKISYPMMFEDNWRPSPLKLLDQGSIRVIGSWFIFSEEDELATCLKGAGASSICGFKTLDTLSSINEGLYGIIFSLCDPKSYMTLLKMLVKMRKPPKLFVVTKGAVYVGDQSPASLPHSGILWGMSKTFRSEHPSLYCKCIDFDPDVLKSEEFLIQELLTIDDAEFQVAYRIGARFVPRLTPVDPSKTIGPPLSLKTSEHYALLLPNSKQIKDLKFVPVPKVDKLPENFVEVEVRAAGLNFKDLLNILKPMTEFDNSNTVGADFSGVVSRLGSGVSRYKLGEAVLGCNWSGGALPSHVLTWEETLAPLPPKWTFEQGATIGTAFSTAYHCLVTVAGLRKGEIALIHTASGAVGLAAIQVAKALGAEVIVTAGTRRKRAFLSKIMNLRHIFNSRNLEFGTEIANVTKCRGVDVVLNSLTGPGFKETSLGTCAKGARFVEMSKLNIWSAEEVRLRRPDIKYKVIDLSVASQESWKHLFTQMREFIDRGKLKPLVYTRYDATQIRDALGYLQTAKHVGKVVVVMPEKGARQNEAKSLLFNDRSTYLITGGLGGIGLKLTKWMTSQGAKYIAICARSEPTAKAQDIINVLGTEGKVVKVFRIDVGDFENCRMLLKEIKSDPTLPPLRGVMHAAGAIVDSLITDQTLEKLDIVFAGKVIGAWNLHQLTLNDILEHFVSFSSISSVLGLMGQVNYAGANCFLDSLTSYRDSLGLAATGVNWGQWGEVGMASEMEISGLRPFSVERGLGALELLLRAPHRTQTTVVEGDISAWKRIYSWTLSYLGELKVKSSGGKGQTSDEMDSGSFWKQIETEHAHEEKLLIVDRAVKSVLARVLRLDEAEELDLNLTFSDLGVDSLMLVELRNVLQGLLGSRVALTLAAISDCNGVRPLANRLLELIYDSCTEKDGVQSVLQ